MEVKKEKIGRAKWRLTVVPESSFWQDFVKQAEERLGQRTIAGFRPGKAPSEVIHAHFGEEAIFDEAFGLAFSALCQRAFKESGLEPVLNPVVENLEKSLSSPEIVLVIITRPEVSLGDYSQIRIKQEQVKVEPNEIEELLSSLRRQKASFKEVERPARLGDLVEIDFAGYLGSQPLPGGEGKNHPLILGEKVFIPGFEENLVGLKVNEAKEFELTFPEDFKQIELSGKRVLFRIQVKKVKEIELPELSSQLAAEFNQPDLEALKTDLERFIERRKKDELNQRYQEKLIDELVRISSIELPAELIEAEVEAILEENKQSPPLKGEERTKISSGAERRLRVGLIIEAISQKEGIGVTKEELAEEIRNLKQSLPSQAQEIEQAYRQGGAGEERLKKMLIGRKTIQQLLNKALL